MIQHLILTRYYEVGTDLMGRALTERYVGASLDADGDFYRSGIKSMKQDPCKITVTLENETVLYCKELTISREEQKFLL